MQASTLYCFCKAYLRPDSVAVPPPYPNAVSFPSSEERRDYEKTLWDAIGIIENLDDDIVAILGKYAGCALPKPRTATLSRLLRSYTEVLSAWNAPRRDIVRSYAWVAPCLYAKLATGEFQSPLVVQLLECFGYKPAPSRQHRRQDRLRAGDDSADRSLERNFRNFKKRYPVFCEALKADLIGDHEMEKERGLEEYRWCDKQGLPAKLLDDLRGNAFAWSTVFSIGGKGQPKVQRASARTTKVKMDYSQKRKRLKI